MAIKRKQKTKPASRIPGVSVGEEVKTSIGEKKKVCFNIGGKWIFRMVDTDWRAPGRPHKTAKSRGHGVKRNKRSEVTPVEHPVRGPGSTGQGGQSLRGQRSEGKRIKNKRAQGTGYKA